MLTAFSTALLLGLLWLRWAYPSAYRIAIREDGPLEDTQAVAFALGGVFAFAAAFRLAKSRKHLLVAVHVVLGLGLLFICGEEISWGQRLFGTPTFAWFERHNLQGENTIHNLSRVQGWLDDAFIAVGLYGGLAWLFLPRKGLARGDWRRFVVPDRQCAVFFLTVAAVYLLLELGNPVRLSSAAAKANPQILTWRDQESAETMLALGFLAVAIANLRKAKVLLRSPRE